MNRLHRRTAVWVIALASLTGGPLPVGSQDRAAERGVRVVARWVVRYERDIHKPESYGGPPLVTYTPYDIRNDAVIVAREEVLDGQDDVRRWFVEDATYHFSQGAITASPKDEPPYLFEAPISTSYHFTKKDFDARITVGQPDSLTEARQRAETLRRELEAAERRGTAEGRAEARRLREELASVESSIRSIEFVLVSHDQFFSAGRDGDRAWASASVCLPQLEYTRVWWAGRRPPPPGVAEFRFDGNANRYSERSSLLLSCGFSAEGSPNQPLVREEIKSDPSGFSMSERTVFVRTPASIPPERDYRLVVEIPDYDSWEPKATRDEAIAGNHLRVEARVVNRDGATPQETVVKRFTFELLGTSAEPGVAINYPPAERGGRKPDLRFSERENFGLVNVEGGDGQTAEVEGSMTRARAVISSFDWGAHAYLLVTAELHDGRVLYGELPGRSRRYDIPIPKCRDGSRIPEHVRERGALGNLPDEDDSEGDVFPGDGLTLYEEYRGFYENGEHRRAAPQKRDLFIRSTIGAVTETGISLFSARSGLAVHYKLKADEIEPDRCINPNRSDGGHRQHGVLIESGAPRSGVAGLTAAAEMRPRPGMARPYTPGEVDRIVVSTAFPTGAANINGSLSVNTSYTTAIAHELGHAVGIDHHGTGDRQETWTVERQPNGRVRLTSGGRQIRVLTEDGAELTLPPGLQSAKVYLGVTGGQHSGDAECFMRYGVAHAYIPPGQPGIRYWVRRTDSQGTGLCVLPNGTGVNAQGRSPSPRYGHATNGNCLAQVRVSDRQPAAP